MILHTITGRSHNVLSAITHMQLFGRGLQLSAAALRTSGTDTDTIHDDLAALQAAHVGKVTLSGTLHPCASSEAVAVLGGVGGLGLLTARWLIDSCGVRHVILLSRSGKASATDLAGTHFFSNIHTSLEIKLEIRI